MPSSLTHLIFVGAFWSKVLLKINSMGWHCNTNLYCFGWGILRRGADIHAPPSRRGLKELDTQSINLSSYVSLTVCRMDGLMVKCVTQNVCKGFGCSKSSAGRRWPDPKRTLCLKCLERERSTIYREREREREEKKREDRRYIYIYIDICTHIVLTDISLYIYVYMCICGWGREREIERE